MACASEPGMTWQAATKALHAAGGGPLKRVEFWPQTIKGQDRGASLTRAAKLGLMERRNKGYVWRWTLTKLGHDWCEGMAPDPSVRPELRIDRDKVLQRVTAGVDAALADVRTLTLRQRDVLVYVAKGLTSKEIAKVMRVEKRTVEKHRMRLMRRLGLEKATEVAVLAAKAGLA
jgi:DNA-binding CsgD family transcriptional regulator